MKRRVLVAVAVLLALAVATSLVQANADGLVSYWPFDGNVEDAVGGNNGTNHGATFVPGVLGQALLFDGVDDYVNISDADSLDITGDITLAAWIKMNYFSTSQGPHMYTMSKDTNGQRSYGIGVDLGHYGVIGRPFFIVFSATSHKIVWGTSALDLHAWYHLAGVFDATTGDLELYVNGAVQPTQSSTLHSIFAGTADLRIGARQYSSSQCFFNGVIDEVGIWSRALTADEVAFLASRVDIDIKPGSDPNCINPDGHGVIPVAILTTDDFDAATVDPFTVTLEGSGVRVKGKSGNAGSLEDVDGDGDLDLVVQITDDSLLAGKDTAILQAQTFGGMTIWGSDTICIVP